MKSTDKLLVGAMTDTLERFGKLLKQLSQKGFVEVSQAMIFIAENNDTELPTWNDVEQLKQSLDIIARAK